MPARDWLAERFISSALSDMIRMYRYSTIRSEASLLTFVAVDGRDVTIPRFRNRKTVHALCLMNGLDGLIVLDKSETADFKLEFYGKDGNASVPGISSACVSVAFADLLGVKPFHSKDYSFETNDGAIHTARIDSHLGECKMVAIDGFDALGVMCEGEFE